MNHTQNLLWVPRVKSRPRVTKYGTYTEKAVLDAEKALAAQYVGPRFEGPIAVDIVFSNDRVSLLIDECDDYTERKLRGDIDNYAKLVLDALNGVAYVDDRQIVSLKLAKT